MEGWLEKIIIHWKKYVIKFCFGVGFFLLFVHAIYKIKSGIYWLEAEWSAGDVLSFGGAILSFVGTVVLGCITTKVSIDNNRINKRLTEIENKREKIEEDKRLGHIVPEQINIRFYEHLSKPDEYGSEIHWTSEANTCTEQTGTLHFILKMNLTSESIVNKVVCKSLKICEYGFGDVLATMSSTLAWIPFYSRTENFHRGINQIDNTFEETIMLSYSDKDTSAFEEMKRLILRNVQYTLIMEFEYVNILQERRKETLRLVCWRDKIVKSEIEI